jgi:PPOX class probable F420-dependent enzyme
MITVRSGPAGDAGPAVAAAPMINAYLPPPSGSFSALIMKGGGGRDRFGDADPQRDGARYRWGTGMPGGLVLVGLAVESREGRALDEWTRELLDGKAFATVATLGVDGAPRTSVVWVMREGDAVVFSTLDVRQKARNLARDPRVSMTVFDPADPYSTVELRGTAELVEDPQRKLSFAVTHKYIGQDPPDDPPGSRRLIVRLLPERVIVLKV